MKTEIYKKEEDTEKKLRLRLVEESGGIYLNAVDEHGNTISYLLWISHEGKLKLTNDIDASLGLDLDTYGKLRVH